ncbi:HEAT repeat domain-containing protein [Deferrisoma camini]|uniref:HEAT repeat domain-containing protein n=1 Tax=Deferrisoma camini TaxID=1035120 RepID=UPI00046CE1FE|nr:HEAT repeat domain-containing protein [Deferrisoma camini]
MEELVRAARAGDSDAAADLVGRMGRPWAEAIRSEAYKAVLALPDEVVEARIREACRSEDPVLREHALAAAGNRGWPWASDEAAAALEDRSFPRRYVGAWVLGELGRPGAAPVLASALAQGGDVAREATRALVKLGAGAVPAILEAAPRLDPAARLQAVLALGDIRDRRAGPLLVEALADPPTRSAAAWALGMLGDPAHAADLLPLLSDPDWRVRMEAARALGVLEAGGADAVLDRLRRDDPVPAVREWAARSLALIRKTPQTFPDETGRERLPDNVYR